ncbi:hypothetical protein [Aliagarivorans taiwanensis]|uniref:hypothetical protein n=1 Tax=Aliagarivorans taiwanensis TaxID=561966 RepID=UPI0004059693|nr:hypothetical protein [Aliagarivorans taiwanensis]
MASKEHDEMCQRAAKYLKSNGFSVSFDDRFQAATGAGELPDALGFRNGASCLIEVKVTRSDFLSDKNKRFRKEPEMGMGDWRFYMCPPEIIKPDELPSGWGLLYCYPKMVKKVVGWPPNTQWSNKPFKSNKQAECDYMYGALRRIQVRGHLDVVYQKT